jgi:signal peptidase I
MIKKLLKEIYLLTTDVFETVILALALFIVINTFVAQLHQVYGSSMLPGFKDSEYLVTDKVTYRFREPQRGEIIIFKAPEAPHRDYIKRIIGLPGESLLIENNQLTIYNATHPQGLVLKETYLRPGTLTEGKKAIPAGVRFTIPSDSYVVLGDNREASSDSRLWGVVKRHEIIGRSLARLWPPQEFSFVVRASYQE